MSEKSPRSRIYIGLEGRRLFVPTPRMWQVKNANEPAQVRKRTKRLTKADFDCWRVKFGGNGWLFKRQTDGSGPYLWGGDPPAGLKLVTPKKQKRRPLKPAADDEFVVERGMLDFREAATLEANCRSLEEDEHTFSPPAITYWLDQFDNAGETWVRPWNLQREDPPDVLIARLKEVEAASESWNYGREGYHWCLKQFPVEGFLDFHRWFWGGRDPRGWYVVPEWVVDFRQELRPRRICEVAKSSKNRNGKPCKQISINSWSRWQDDPLARAALADARRRAERGMEPDESADVWVRLKAKYERAPNGGRNEASYIQMRNAMVAFAREGTLKAALARVGKQNGSWQSERRAAKLVGGEDLKQQLTEWVTAPHGVENDCGVVNLNAVSTRIFSPPSTMRRCRGENVSRFSYELRRLRNRLPADLFLLWFLDWTLPSRSNSELGRQLRERFLIEDGPIIRAAGEATPDPFVPIDGKPLDDFQCQILRLLDGKALSKDACLFQLDISPHPFYRMLKPLMHADRVRSDRKMGGYFRPDSPPRV